MDIKSIKLPSTSKLISVLNSLEPQIPSLFEFAIRSVSQNITKIPVSTIENSLHQELRGIWF